ncbi:uncharacterized protein LOC124167102 [Ischnura elegans]|uniref:uncharacterized protein LOC124167102 n=1 Tax=Ischnura elegans TaxID=197161 RepID=UPI001ED89781|nr:uncharacterized protein LOC124167102 [Ischnura elegans]
MFLCEDDPVNLLSMDQDITVTLKCANKTSRSVDIFLISSGHMLRYATLLPQSSLKVKGRFSCPMVFRDSETEEVVWIKKRRITGLLPQTGEECQHCIVYVTRGVPSLKELTMRVILPYVRDRRDIASLELPETLKGRLGKMVDRRMHFLNFFALKFNSITDVPKLKNCIVHTCDIPHAFGLFMGPYP